MDIPEVYFLFLSLSLSLTLSPAISSHILSCKVHINSYPAMHSSPTLPPTKKNAVRTLAGPLDIPVEDGPDPDEDLPTEAEGSKD